MKVGLVYASRHGHNGVQAVVLELNKHLGPETATVIGPEHPRSVEIDGIFFPSRCYSKHDDYYDIYLSDYATGEALRDALLNLDIVHLHSVSAMTFRTLRVIQSMPIRPKVVFHVHTHYPDYNRMRFGPKKSRVTIPPITWLHRYHAWMADMIIFPSDWARDELGPIIGLEKNDPRVVVWSAPVEEYICEVENLQIVDSVNGILPSDTPYLSFVGRLSDEKNLGRLIKLYREIHSLIAPKLALVITGSGDQTPYRKIAVSEGVSHKVFFTGQVSEGGVCLLSRGAIAAISYCRNETQALGNLRQMLYVPLIAPAGTVLEEHIRKSGGGFTFDGTKDFLSGMEVLALDLILNDRATRAEMSDRARQYVLRNFNSRDQYDSLDAHYARLLAG